MRIGIDVRQLSGQKTGIGVYVFNLIKELAFLDNQNEYFLYSNKYFDTALLQGAPNFKPRITTGWRNNLWLQIKLPYLLRKDKIDLFHSPVFIIPIAYSGPSIVTVHDLTVYSHPEKHNIKNKIILKTFLPNTIKKANFIIADSEAVKKDILSIFKIPEGKIRVIYLGVSNKYRHNHKKEILEKIKKKYNLPDKFILHVGSVAYLKNISLLLRVFSNFQKDRNFSDYYLINIGMKGKGAKQVFQLVGSYNLTEKVRFLGYVSDEDMPAIYNLATLFVFPSLQEGFGLPPLEAMASGVPVIVSKSASLPEVVGDAGILCDPFNADEFTQAIRQVLTAPILKNELREKGLIRASQFTWQKTVAQTLNIYKEVLQNANRN